jgi:hypothetical protein
MVVMVAVVVHLVGWEVSYDFELFLTQVEHYKTQGQNS